MSEPNAQLICDRCGFNGGNQADAEAGGICIACTTGNYRLKAQQASSEGSSEGSPSDWTTEEIQAVLEEAADGEQRYCYSNYDGAAAMLRSLQTRLSVLEAENARLRDAIQKVLDAPTPTRRYYATRALIKAVAVVASSAAAHPRGDPTP